MRSSSRRTLRHCPGRRGPRYPRVEAGPGLPARRGLWPARLRRGGLAGPAAALSRVEGPAWAAALAKGASAAQGVVWWYDGHRLPALTGADLKSQRGQAQRSAAAVPPWRSWPHGSRQARASMRSRSRPSRCRRPWGHEPEGSRCRTRWVEPSVIQRRKEPRWWIGLAFEPLSASTEASHDQQTHGAVAWVARALHRLIGARSNARTTPESTPSTGIAQADRRRRQAGGGAGQGHRGGAEGRSLGRGDCEGRGTARLADAGPGAEALRDGERGVASQDVAPGGPDAEGGSSRLPIGRDHE